MTKKDKDMLIPIVALGGLLLFTNTKFAKPQEDIFTGSGSSSISAGEGETTGITTEGYPQGIFYPDYNVYRSTPSVYLPSPSDFFAQTSTKKETSATIGELKLTGDPTKDVEIINKRLGGFGTAYTTSSGALQFDPAKNISSYTAFETEKYIAEKSFDAGYVGGYSKVGGGISIGVVPTKKETSTTPSASQQLYTPAPQYYTPAPSTTTIPSSSQKLYTPAPSTTTTPSSQKLYTPAPSTTTQTKKEASATTTKTDIVGSITNTIGSVVSSIASFFKW